MWYPFGTRRTLRRSPLRTWTPTLVLLWPVPAEYLFSRSAAESFTLRRKVNSRRIVPRMKSKYRHDCRYCSRGQVFENGVVGGEILLVHHPEALVGSVSEASHLEDATERGGGSVERRPPAVHLGDAQQRGVLEHPVA